MLIVILVQIQLYFLSSCLRINLLLNRVFPSEIITRDHFKCDFYSSTEKVDCGFVSFARKGLNNCMILVSPITACIYVGKLLILHQSANLCSCFCCSLIDFFTALMRTLSATSPTIEHDDHFSLCVLSTRSST